MMLATKLQEAAANSTLPTYIEDVFSTYLYTGTGAMRSISNGIDLAGEGGLVWIKDRAIGYDHCLFDTARGVDLRLVTNSTGAQATQASRMVTAFNSDGFTLGNVSTGTYDAVNELNQPFASWTFRKQPKFFDVVTYTGTGANRTISHALGSVPACIIVKRTDTTGAWQVYHRSLANTEYLVLNTIAAKATGATRWNSTTPTSTVFSLGTDATVNASGGTYVAYIFAHDAGGFGLTGTDNVISCGSYTGNGSATGQEISLGFEPQWLLIKNVTDTGGYSWILTDNMRGMNNNTAVLLPNTNDAEWPIGNYLIPNGIGATATGFYLGNNDGATNASANTYIYIAIRRGPMKVPTSGTSVFSANTTSAATGTAITTNFPVDLQMLKYRSGAQATMVLDRLRGVSTSTTEAGVFLQTSNTNAEVSDNTVSRYWNNTGYQVASGWTLTNQVNWNFRRAPSFFDEVCYTGNGLNTNNQNHNLGVVPELIIVKRRDTARNWFVYSSTLGNATSVYLNLTTAATSDIYAWNSTTPTATQFTLGNETAVNASSSTYVAYLFATCAGVSKVGSYTGNGSSQTINCGFTAGPRFVMVKRTDSTGDWYVFDSARGLTGGGDNSLLLNTTGEEDLYNNSDVGPESVGFSVGPTYQGLNASGGTYIFLAIA